MILIEVRAPVSGTPAGCKRLITRERILVGRVAPTAASSNQRTRKWSAHPSQTLVISCRSKQSKGRSMGKEGRAEPGTDLVSMEPKLSKQRRIVREDESSQTGRRSAQQSIIPKKVISKTSISNLHVDIWRNPSSWMQGSDTHPAVCILSSSHIFIFIWKSLSRTFYFCFFHLLPSPPKK